MDIGQTVASSFSTPTLFSIANDLTKMQLQASIDEADIGKIKVGQDVTFKVDAYMDQSFGGVVRQIRLQPTTVQNVVNYTVVIDVPNPDKKLMPGMTANLTIKTQEALNVFKTPSAALRFWPPQEYFDKHLKEYPDSTQKMIERALKFMARRQSGQSGSGGQQGSGMQAGSGGQTAGGRQSEAGGQQPAGQGGFNRQGGQSASGGQQSAAGIQPGAGQGRQGWGGFNRQKMGMIWVKQGNLIYPHRVKTGISDNSYTEIDGSVKEGDEVITSIVNTNPSQTTTQQQSPFAPQMGRPQGGGASGAGGRGGR